MIWIYTVCKDRDYPGSAGYKKIKIRMSSTIILNSALKDHRLSEDSINIQYKDVISTLSTGGLFCFAIFPNCQIKKYIKDVV